MKKIRASFAVAAVAVLVGACSPGNNFRDVEGVQSKNPDSIENFNNMDLHPNIGKVCIYGVAFLTTTRDYDAVTRVPEWDKTCPAPAPR